MHFDATFFALVALVLFLGVVFYAGAHRKAGAALDDRRALIAKELDDARKLREEAEALLAEYKQKRLDAEKEALAIVAQARTDATAFAEESKTKLAASIERRTRQAEQKIAQAEASALKDVRNAATDAAIAAAAKLMSDVTKGTKGGKFIDESIAAVKGRLN
jgi:F-type H+-transporting ATPase subunit b